MIFSPRRREEHKEKAKSSGQVYIYLTDTAMQMSLRFFIIFCFE